MNNVRTGVIAIGGALAIAGWGTSLPALQQDHGAHGQAPGRPPGASTRITMQALHAAGGVPPGWRFSLPAGDPAAGRQVFIDTRCHTCHALRGEQFPLKPGEAATAGPDLTGMGASHPTGYLVESILNPSAVLVEGPGFIGGDDRSIMPPTPDLTVKQLIDLVAYLQSAGREAPHHAHDQAREQTSGGYRVRLVYRPAAGGAHGHQQHGAGAPPGKGRLVAFISDAASGQPIPYAPVTARVEAAGKTGAPVTLGPAMGPEGFHYAGDVALPADTSKVTLAIGPAALRLEPGAPAQLARAHTVAFDWK
jgi:hypothetical protein